MTRDTLEGIPAGPTSYRLDLKISIFIKEARIAKGKLSEASIKALVHREAG